LVYPLKLLKGTLINDVTQIWEIFPPSIT
jgi:hypothetical protein